MGRKLVGSETETEASAPTKTRQRQKGSLSECRALGMRRLLPSAAARAWPQRLACGRSAVELYPFYPWTPFFFRPAGVIPEMRFLTRLSVRMLCRRRAMLSVREVTALLEILQSAQSLEAAAAAFQRAFVRAEHFRVAQALCVLIEDGLLPGTP